MSETLLAEAKKIFGEAFLPFSEKKEVLPSKKLTWALGEIKTTTTARARDIIADLLIVIRNIENKSIKLAHKYVNGLLEFTKMNSLPDYIEYVIKYEMRPVENIPE